MELIVPLVDRAKAKNNFQKHKVRFSDVEIVLSDPMALTVEDHDVEGEKRFVTVGSDSIGRIILVVYTYRNDEVRLISARKTTHSERKLYEEGI